MTVAELRIDMRQSAAPGLCRVRVWLLPADSPHRAELRAREIVRDVLRCAGIVDDDVVDAEHIVAELAVNAVQHAAPPYEMRIAFAGEVWPAWCEVADGSTEFDDVRRWLRGVMDTPASDGLIPELTERERGLRMVAGLSYGRCAAYPATVCQTGSAGKAVGFALPGTGGACCQV